MKLFSWSAQEQRLLSISHIGEAWQRTKDYQPLPQPEGIAGVPLAVGNLVGKGAHFLVTAPDALFHDVADPNDPEALPGGPMQRTRQKVGSIIGRVFSEDIVKKPIRTVATAAYETLFELPQNVILDVPETLSGNTHRTRYDVSKALAA